MIGCDIPYTIDVEVAGLCMVSRGMGITVFDNYFNVVIGSCDNGWPSQQGFGDGS